MWETWVQSLGWEDPVEKGTATHSNILAWKIPWIEEPGRLQSMGLQRVGHDWASKIRTQRKFFLQRSVFWLCFFPLDYKIIEIANSFWEFTLYPRQYTKTNFNIIVVVQSLSCVRLFVTPWTAAGQDSLSVPITQSLLKLMSIELVLPSNHIILCYPFLLLPSIFPSIRVFSNESALCIKWPKYWSFSFSISSFCEYSGLISFMIDWFDLLAVQGTLKSFLQHHSSKASILWHSAFSHIHTWKWKC